MKIKICGITEIETLNFLIENGVDYVGLFSRNSPRNVKHTFINEIKNINFQKTGLSAYLLILISHLLALHYFALKIQSFNFMVMNQKIL